MNPYVSFSIAMCLVVLLSLGATAYLAVMFNRRGKVDLGEALAPLAELIEGEVDLEDTRTNPTMGTGAPSRSIHSGQIPM